MGDLDNIAAAAFYVVLAWQREKGRPMLMPDGNDIVTLDDAMEDLEFLFLRQKAGGNDGKLGDGPSAD